MNVKFFHYFFLVGSIISGFGLSYAMEAPEAAEVGQRKPLPLIYQSLLHALINKVRDKKDLPPNVQSVIESNPELNRVYDILKNPKDLGLWRDKWAEDLYKTLSRLDIERFVALINLIAFLKDNPRVFSIFSGNILFHIIYILRHHSKVINPDAASLSDAPRFFGFLDELLHPDMPLYGEKVYAEVFMIPSDKEELSELIKQFIDQFEIGEETDRLNLLRIYN